MLLHFGPFSLLFYADILFHVVFTNGELFTAMADIENLLQTENHMVSVIDQYIQTEMKRLERLRAFAEDYQRKNEGALEEGLDYISNPVNAYLLIKRMSSDWTLVENMMRSNAGQDYIKNITEHRDESYVRFPEQVDLDGAAVALMRLQDTYKLETGDIAEGRIDKVQRTGPLDAHDCFEIGRIAYNKRDYYHTLMWMEEAIQRMLRESPPTITEAEVLEYLAFAMYHQGNVKRALKLTKRLYQIQPEHPRAKGNIKYYEDELMEQGYKKGDDRDLPPVVNQRQHNEDGLFTGEKERNTYEALCRGEQMKSNADLAKLYCHYKSDTPFTRLAPLKVEILHWKPKIVVFRQVVSDQEIDVIKELASPMLQRATVKDGKGGLITVNYRIAKSAWLKGYHDPTIAQINKRLVDMTGLSMDTAEDLQIANYGIGGHYEPHYDMSTRDDEDMYDGTGNRIATVLFYFSQPEGGGATVFLELNLTLRPQKNDAVFWHNLYNNGEPDLTTRHAACPVVAGAKWVGNKWIHEAGQEFRRKCALDKNEYE